MTLSFSQKVGKRELGNVGGIQGFLKWTSKGVKPQVYKFLMIENESNPHDPTEVEQKLHCFSTLRCIKIYLEPESGKLCKEVFDIFRKLDDLFSPYMEGVQMCLSCRACQKIGQTGFFRLERGIELSLDNTQCSELDKHRVDTELTEMMNKPFSLDSLDQIKPEDLKTFRDSDIHQKMERGEMEVGQQVWIFHDSETDRWNCIANLNPYAHVVVYVGSRHEKGRQGETRIVHEVVHVSKSWKCCTLMKAEICREDVKKVKNSLTDDGPWSSF